MAGLKTPHTQTRQNMDPAAADLDENQRVEDAGRGEDVELYKNMDGAQTGGTRAFSANDIRSHAYRTLESTAAPLPACVSGGRIRATAVEPAPAGVQLKAGR